MRKKCIIFGAGVFRKIKIEKENNLIIAADGGYNHLKKIGIEPDLIVGDMDSIKKVPNKIKTIRLNPQKDETDMMIAVEEGKKRGFKNFHIYGGTGGEASHTFANIQLLNRLAKENLTAYIFGLKEIFIVIKNKTIFFNEKMKGKVSVFSMEEESRGIYEDGLKYSLTDYTMRSDDIVGISNEFIGEKSKIQVKNGSLLIIFNKQDIQNIEIM